MSSPMECHINVDEYQDSDFEKDGVFKSVIYHSPNGTEGWIPACDLADKPCVGMSFISIDEAFQFYLRYSKLCLFDIRRGSDKRASDGSIIRKYITCNKEGSRLRGVADTLDRSVYERSRLVPSIMSDCKARITLKRKGNEGFYISQFTEVHNHSMTTEDGAKFLKSRRQLSYVHKKTVVDLSKVNIGPVVAHNVFKGLSGGYENVGATSADFKNIQRDIVAEIGCFDAQMVIEKFQNKQEVAPSFFYEYYVENGVLTRIFWADPICLRNYGMFGEVVSFDATYNLNKYRLIFVPFTGVDNHKRSVNFGAALISSEDAESYMWVLQAFLKCFGSPPKVVITDQDAALRKVIPIIMPNARHRFCMWHIMKKMSAKVGFISSPAKEFRRLQSSIIYSEELEIDEFESKWKHLIQRFNFEDNQWLANMFQLRHFWIPAYFRDVPLGGLLRTTSRSESQNSFFGRFLRLRMNLLAFMTGFESALENQRNAQALAEHDSLIKKPNLLTPLAIESDLRIFYTIRVFRDVQAEIAASGFDLSVISVKEVGNTRVFELKDARFIRRNFTVNHELGSNDFECSCKLFMRCGYQCRHVFFSMRSAGIIKMPRKYILRRWTTNPISGLDSSLNTSFSNIRVDSNPSSLIWTELHTCLMLAAHDTHKIEELLSKVKDFRLSLESESLGSGSSQLSRSEVVGKLLGAVVPTNLTIKSPAYVHTKGSGKRLKGDRELAIEKSKRCQRICSLCKEFGTHDKRTCPLKEFHKDAGGVCVELDNIIEI